MIGLIVSEQLKGFANTGYFEEQASVLPHLHPRLNSLVVMATMDYEQENGRYDSMQNPDNHLHLLLPMLSAL